MFTPRELQRGGHEERQTFDPLALFASINKAVPTSL
jgi:hypothetical protein